jgi:hypothetical protein
VSQGYAALVLNTVHHGRATVSGGGEVDAHVMLALLKEILVGTVQLPGAACIGRHELFDAAPGNDR